MAMLKVKTENQMANPVPSDGHVFAFVVQNSDGSCAVKVKLPDGKILTVSGDDGPQGPQGPQGKALTFADLTDAQKAALKGEKGDTGGSFLIQVVSSLPSKPEANVLYLIPEE